MYSSDNDQSHNLQSITASIWDSRPQQDQARMRSIGISPPRSGFIDEANRGAPLAKNLGLNNSSSRSDCLLNLNFSIPAEDIAIPMVSQTRRQSSISSLSSLFLSQGDERHVAASGAHLEDQLVCDFLRVSSKKPS